VALLAVGKHAQHVVLAVRRAEVVGRRRRGERGERRPRLGEQGQAARGDAVVAPALILYRGVGPPVGLHDQVVVQQAPDGAIERAGAEDNFPVRVLLDGAHEGVAVALLPVGERPQDVVAAIRHGHVVDSFVLIAVASVSGA